ncbi:hypothetical protein M569_08967, partial [Genlisea aurea]
MFYENDNAFGTPYEMRGCELKAGMLNNLPKFHGRGGEDPHKHIKEFQVICATMKSEGNDDEEVMLQAFPFSLMDGAKDWFFSLESGSIDSWLAMKRAFLERYFPATQVGYARKELCSIRQQTGETLHEYWERFKRQLASCPNHQLPPLLLMQFFYQGLFDMERMMIDASCGGCFLNKTPEEAKDLVTMVANNAQQYGLRDRGVKVVNAATTNMNGMEQKMDNLTSMMSKLVDKVSNKVVCAICCTEGHESVGCPLLRSTEGDMSNVETVNALGGQVNPRNDPYSNRYNPGWRNHPNLSWKSTNYENYDPATHMQHLQPQNQNRQQQTNQYPNQQQYQSRPPPGFGQQPQQYAGQQQAPRQKTEMEQ